MMGAGDGALNEGGVASNEAGGALKEVMVIWMKRMEHLAAFLCPLELKHDILFHF